MARVAKGLRKAKKIGGMRPCVLSFFKRAIRRRIRYAARASIRAGEDVEMKGFRKLDYLIA